MAVDVTLTNAYNLQCTALLETKSFYLIFSWEYVCMCEYVFSCINIDR